MTCPTALWPSLPCTPRYLALDMMDADQQPVLLPRSWRYPGDPTDELPNVSALRKELSCFCSSLCGQTMKPSADLTGEGENSTLTVLYLSEEVIKAFTRLILPHSTSQYKCICRWQRGKGIEEIQERAKLPEQKHTGPSGILETAGTSRPQPIMRVSSQLPVRDVR